MKHPFVISSQHWAPLCIISRSVESSTCLLMPAYPGTTSCQPWGALVERVSGRNVPENILIGSPRVMCLPEQISMTRGEGMLTGQAWPCLPILVLDGVVGR